MTYFSRTKTEPLQPYKFCIFNPATLDPLFPDEFGAIPDNVLFYEKINFVAYLRPSTRERIKLGVSDYIYELARSALYDEDCEILSDGEYAEDLSECEFICFIDGQKDAMDGQLYLESHNLHYEFSGSEMTEFGYWEDDVEDFENDTAAVIGENA